MCNLSVGVYERGWNASLQKEQDRKKRFLISDLWKMHMDIQTIARLAECSEEEVHVLAKEMGL